jgi:hypothetical protein
MQHAAMKFGQHQMLETSWILTTSLMAAKTSIHLFLAKIRDRLSVSKKDNIFTLEDGVFLRAICHLTINTKGQLFCCIIPIEGWALPFLCLSPSVPSNVYIT